MAKMPLRWGLVNPERALGMQEQPNPEGPGGPDASRSTASSGPQAQPAVGIDNQPFGASLAPVLAEACDGRLGEVRWFRADWQRGGALTGYATFRDKTETDLDVVVKLPVPPAERTWLVRLGAWPDVVPRVYAQGESLGGYDIAWVVMERLPHGPLGAVWGGAEFDLLADVAGRFYAAASTFPADGQPRERDWRAIAERARKAVPQRQLAQSQRWQKALKKAQRKLADWLDTCADRPQDQWCHGDLHLANAMTRTPAPGGPAVLLDLALVHLGHWVEDAVYWEHLFWSQRKRLGDRRLCSMIAKRRKEAKLPVGADWPRWAAAQRGLLAMSTPIVPDHAGNAAHAAAALEVLEAEAGA